MKRHRGIKNLYTQRGRFYYARQVNGSRPFVDLQTSDESEALRRIAELERSPLLAAKRSGLRAEIDRFVAHKIARREYSRDSGATKVLILREFADWLPAAASAATVRPDQCAAFYERLRDRVSESTAESYMMTLRSFFRYQVTVRRTRLDNPVAKIALGRAEHIARKRFVDKRTKNALLKAVPDDDLRFILFCGFDAGLRRGEISEARVDWFELKHGGSLHVQRSVGKRLPEGQREWRPKYNKERVIPLTRPFRKFLAGYLKGREPLDFALQPEIGHGRWRYRYDIRRPFAEFMETQARAGLAEAKWITPHVMRHSFASILKIAGVSTAKIAEWLGDTERVTERTYAHLKPDDRDVHALT